MRNRFLGGTMIYMKWRKRTTTTALIVLLALLALAAAALAQHPDEVEWQATYWNNVSLSGEPALTRTEGAIDHDWGRDAPDGLVNADNFSARWTTTVDLPQGRYRFTATVDDGIRLWVDGHLLINNWAVQPPHTMDAEMELDGGEVPIRVEYFDQSGPAIMQLTWTPLQVTSSTWYAEFFDNRSLEGRPELIRNDGAINFNWGESSPASDVLHPDAFSARWRRTISVEEGEYRFRILVDDGARLWVDEELIIDAWQPQPATLYEADVALEEGNAPVRLEYYENGGLAQVALEWVRLPDEPVAPAPAPTVVVPGDAPQPPSTEDIVVDEDGDGFLRGGRPVDDWQEEANGFGGDSLWTYNSERLPTAYNWGQWQADLEPGVYEVFVYIPAGYATTTQARYWIGHANGPTLRIVDQASNRGRWLSLGTFYFEGAGSYVSLADLTFEEAQSAIVAYDAVRWSLLDPSAP